MRLDVLARYLLAGTTLLAGTRCNQACVSRDFTTGYWFSSEIE